MKLLFTLSTLLLASSLFAQTFCLRLSEVSNDGNNYVVSLEMQGSSTFKLGSSNLQWSFNTLGLGDPILLSSPLMPPFYQVPTVTSQGTGEVSFNIELGFEGFGTTIAADPAWTEVGQVSFPIVNVNNIGAMTWTYNGGTTQTVVFLDDEATQIFATNPTCLIGIDIPASVDLLAFDAYKKEHSVLLKWKTGSEENNQGFQVEKSVDAQHWLAIAWVDGKVTSKEVQHYQAVDQQPWDGSNYYRLKQVDHSGQMEYSPVREVTFESDDKIQLFPNPADKETFIKYPSDYQLKEITVYDQMGHLVFSLLPQSNRLDVSALNGGVYFIEIRTADERRFYKKLLIQKR